MKMHFKLAYAAVLTSMLTLTGCSSFKPETQDCTKQVTVPPVGSNMVILSEAGQEVAVRLNGITAQCHDKNDGTVINVDVGLKVTRNLEQNSDAQYLRVPFITAIIDGDDKVVDHSSFGYRMAFGKNIGEIYPLTDFKLTIPKGGRLILSLITEEIELK